MCTSLANKGLYIYTFYHCQGEIFRQALRSDGPRRGGSRSTSRRKESPPGLGRPCRRFLALGAELAAPESSTSQDGKRTVIAIREGAQDSINQVGQEITMRNGSIQPTLTIRPGFPMRVMVSKDLGPSAVSAAFLNRGSSQ